MNDEGDTNTDSTASAGNTDSAADTRHVDNASSGGDETMDPKALLQQVKDLKAGFTTLAQERATDREFLAEIRGRLSERANNTPVPEELDPLDQSKWTDEMKAEFADITPSQLKLLMLVRAADRKYTADTIEDGITEKSKSLADQIAEVTDPDLAKVKDVIDELSSQPWFKKLGRRDQIEAAKNFKGTSAGAIAASGMTPPGTGPGLGRRLPQPTQVDERGKAIKAWARGLFPERTASSRLIEPRGGTQ
jgi:hypothetical protein